MIQLTLLNYDTTNFTQLWNIGRCSGRHSSSASGLSPLSLCVLPFGCWCAQAILLTLLNYHPGNTTNFTQQLTLLNCVCFPLAVGAPRQRGQGRVCHSVFEISLGCLSHDNQGGLSRTHTHTHTHTHHTHTSRTHTHITHTPHTQTHIHTHTHTPGPPRGAFERNL